MIAFRAELADRTRHEGENKREDVVRASCGMSDGGFDGRRMTLRKNPLTTTTPNVTASRFKINIGPLKSRVHCRKRKTVGLPKKLRGRQAEGIKSVDVIGCNHGPPIPTRFASAALGCAIPAPARVAGSSRRACTGRARRRSGRSSAAGSCCLASGGPIRIRVAPSSRRYRARCGAGG